MFVTAAGRARWSYVTRRVPPPGEYQLAVRAIDAADNLERAARRNVRRFNVRG